MVCVSESYDDKDNHEALFDAITFLEEKKKNDNYSNSNLSTMNNLYL